ncbi:MAG: serine/threonine-protein kinase [Polyangia bacterium]
MGSSQVGYYRLERLLGEGGMGAVYLGVHEMTGRRVAVKMLRAAFADRADLNARFFNEARTISHLEHRGIVRVLDVARASDGTSYMVMELCQGPTLAEVFASGTSLPVKLGLLGAMADALSHAHAHGIVHRDLKPDNVIVTASPDGAQPRVLDFGIAKVLESGLLADSSYQVKTRTGTAMGTPLYMSPEQCRGMGGITAATDVYALGCMLYEAVTGRLPFDGGVGEVIVHHLTTPAPALGGATLTDAHAGLAPLVRSTLEKDPALRPSMTFIAVELAQYAGARHLLEIASPELPPVATTQVDPTVGEWTSPEISTRRPLPPFAWLLIAALPLIAVALVIYAHGRGPVPSVVVVPSVVAPAPHVTPPPLVPPPAVSTKPAPHAHRARPPKLVPPPRVPPPRPGPQKGG